MFAPWRNGAPNVVVDSAAPDTEAALIRRRAWSLDRHLPSNRKLRGRTSGLLRPLRSWPTQLVDNAGVVAALYLARPGEANASYMRSTDLE